MADFVHLHNHSEFSLLDGLQKTKNMVGYAKELGMKALAITDHGCLQRRVARVDDGAACAPVEDRNVDQRTDRDRAVRVGELGVPDDAPRGRQRAAEIRRAVAVGESTLDRPANRDGRRSFAESSATGGEASCVMDRCGIAETRTGSHARE